MDREEGRTVYRHLVAVVGEALKRPRDSRDPPSDVEVAVMTVFEELDRLGYRMVRPRTP